MQVDHPATSRSSAPSRPTDELGSENLPLPRAVDVGPWAVHAEATARPLLRGVLAATLFASTALLVRSADGAVDVGRLRIVLLPVFAGVTVLWFTLHQAARAVDAGTRRSTSAGAPPARATVLALVAAGVGWCGVGPSCSSPS